MGKILKKIAVFASALVLSVSGGSLPVKAENSYTNNNKKVLETYADPYSVGYWDDAGNWIGEGWWNKDEAGNAIYHPADNYASYNLDNGYWNDNYSAPSTPSYNLANGGDGGRLYFPDGWSVALNYDWSGWNGQYIVNNWDSACVQTCWPGITVICDHAYQGFSRIRNLGAGSVITWVSADGYAQKYRCVSTHYAWNNGYDMYFDDGTSYTTRYTDELCLQTCTDSTGIHDFVSCWVPVY